MSNLFDRSIPQKELQNINKTIQHLLDDYNKLDKRKQATVSVVLLNIVLKIAITRSTENLVICHINH